MAQQVELLTENDTDRSVVVAVKGTKYEYFLGDKYEHAIRDFKQIHSKSPFKALNVFKTRADRVQRLNP